MRVLARQIWWLQVMRITIGCLIIAMGVVLPWLGAGPVLSRSDWRVVRVLLVGGALLILAGILFAGYALLEWRPGGFAVGISRRGLILKVNGRRCPSLIAIRWSQIRGAHYEPPRYRWNPGIVKIYLHQHLPAGRLPATRGGVVELGPNTIGLNGRWELWHPADVAQLINSAASDPALRASR
jgi:hypothetical protein